jgi:hypothetical protein
MPVKRTAVLLAIPVLLLVASVLLGVSLAGG